MHGRTACAVFEVEDQSSVLRDVRRYPTEWNSRLKQIESTYANTDFDLRSPKPFDVLNTELSDACCILHYAEAQDGTWTASYEADRLNDSATNDILAFIDVLSRLSDVAKQELVQCTVRDFNVGVNCWDTWAYNIGIPPSTVASVANAGCSISFTLYPMREPDGTPKIDPDGG